MKGRFAIRHYYRCPLQRKAVDPVCIRTRVERERDRERERENDHGGCMLARVTQEVGRPDQGLRELYALFTILRALQDHSGVMVS